MKYIIDKIKKSQECLNEAKTEAEKDTPDFYILQYILNDAVGNIKKASKELDLKWTKRRKLKNSLKDV